MTGRYVFGYGSLARDAGGVPARLVGWSRGWGVAMDNARDLPGYKYYTSRDGGRPAVHVCFLDVAPAASGSVNGVCLPVTDAQLTALDRRERNYERRDVTAAIRAPVRDARVFTYVGSAAGRRRFEDGTRSGTAVIAAGYRGAVLAAFAALGADALAAARPSLDPGPLAVVDLVRHEL